MFNNPKFDSLFVSCYDYVLTMKVVILNLFQEEPYLDSDLEPNVAEEVDYFPGERLLKDKFSVSYEVQCDNSKFYNN